MPLTEKGEAIRKNMEQEYGPEKGKEIFYASKNSGTISGVDNKDESETEKAARELREKLAEKRQPVLARRPMDAADPLAKPKASVPVFYPSENYQKLVDRDCGVMVGKDVAIFQPNESVKAEVKPQEYPLQTSSIPEKVTPKDMNEAFKKYWETAQPNGHQTEFGDDY